MVWINWHRIWKQKITKITLYLSICVYIYIYIKAGDPCDILSTKEKPFCPWKFILEPVWNLRPKTDISTSAQHFLEDIHWETAVTEITVQKKTTSGSHSLGKKSVHNVYVQNKYEPITEMPNWVRCTCFSIIFSDICCTQDGSACSQVPWNECTVSSRVKLKSLFYKRGPWRGLKRESEWERKRSGQQGYSYQSRNRGWMEDILSDLSNREERGRAARPDRPIYEETRKRRAEEKYNEWIREEKDWTHWPPCLLSFFSSGLTETPPRSQTDPPACSRCLSYSGGRQELKKKKDFTLVILCL